MPSKKNSPADRKRGFAAVNRELWLLLAIFVLAALANNVVASQQVVLGLYMLPTLFSAFCYGRRHAVMTAIASITLVVVVTYFRPIPASIIAMTPLQVERWFDLAAWGAILMITGYTMGTLYERVSRNVVDLRSSYEGMSALLQQLISNGKLVQNNRLASCATRIGEGMRLSFERVEDIRAAALLSDLVKSGISVEQFRNAVAKKLTDKETPLDRAISILLDYQSAKSGKNPAPASVEAQVLLLAELYDSSSQGTRLSPSQVIEKISTQKRFDGAVVEGFKLAFA